jgi:hypothetical protein
MGLFAATGAYAAPVLLCSTGGDALGGADLIENEKGEAQLSITSLDDTQAADVYTLRARLKNIKVGDSDTLVGEKPTSTSFGGGTSDAALIRVMPGQKTAVLSVKGTVYNLNCSKP